MRTVVKVTSIAQICSAVPILPEDRLVNIVPDESALIQRIVFRKLDIFQKRPAGIAHGMRIFTADIGFLPVL